MVNGRYLQAIVRELTATRLHKSSSGFRCRCGACRHQILVTAARTGIPAQRLIAALPPERPAEEKRRPRAPRRLAAQVASSMTVARGRNRLRGPSAVLSLLEAD